LPIFLHLVGLLFLSHNFLSVKLPDAALSSFGFFHFVRLSFLLAAQNNKRAVSIFFSLLFSFLISINTMPKKKKYIKKVLLSRSLVSLPERQTHTRTQETQNTAHRRASG